MIATPCEVQMVLMVINVKNSICPRWQLPGWDCPTAGGSYPGGCFPGWRLSQVATIVAVKQSPRIEDFTW